ncbi:Uu.00g111760.m01.CDS01 [Anthostomella pinea]|uniref:Uu.00g111760.m01.CDS01 n=1 Tax=Anthostomella pinea TaxID=933095 RepID=A0AAI8VF65_9PEZI|nr:Uu.00g111760.m01.CDS01 [Anthostomella pinea]
MPPARAHNNLLPRTVFLDFGDEPHPDKAYRGYAIGSPLSSIAAQPYFFSLIQSPTQLEYYCRFLDRRHDLHPPQVKTYDQDRIHSFGIAGSSMTLKYNFKGWYRGANSHGMMIGTMVSKLLLDKGADPTVSNAFGMQPGRVADEDPANGRGRVLRVEGPEHIVTQANLEVFWGQSMY